MVIGFKEQFVPLILNGVKKHTIRKDKHERWSAGKLMHMATGVRTKDYRQFDELVCTDVQKISIVYNKIHSKVQILIDGKYYGSAFFDKDTLVYFTKSIETLARNDGFESVDDFFKWFDKDFNGRIIHWTNLRYGAN